MAAKGTLASFTDQLQGLLAQVMGLAAAPDADVDFLMGLRDQFFEKLGLNPAGGPQPGEMAMPGGTPTPALPPLPGMGAAPMAGMGTEPLSRGPTPGTDMRGATAELERILAGS